MDWVQNALAQYGLGGILIAMFAIALWKGLPPVGRYLVRKIDELQANDAKKTDAFLEALKEERERGIRAAEQQRTAHTEAMDRQENKFIDELDRARADTVAALNQQGATFVNGQKQQSEALNKQTDMLQQLITMVQELVADQRRFVSEWNGKDRRTPPSNPND